jgi:hypothetical protein
MIAGDLIIQPEHITPGSVNADRGPIEQVRMMFPQKWNDYLPDKLSRDIERRGHDRRTLPTHTLLINMG